MTDPVFPGMPMQVDPGCTAWSDLTDATVKTQLETRAVWLLWALAGRAFGLETVTDRPVRPWEQLATNVPTWPYSTPYAGWPVSLALLSMFQGGTDPRAVVALDAPVKSVDTVKVDGAVLDPGSYQLFGARLLVRTDGQVWPQHQRITDPDTEPGTFSVTYTRGRDLPPSGQIAAGLLACELAKARADDPNCQLPERIKTISRDGIDVQFLDPMDFVKEGRTGIPAVDEWLRAVNPAGIDAPADVWSPDLGRNYRVAP